MKTKTPMAQLRDKLLESETTEKTDFAKGYMQCLKDIALSIELQMFPIEREFAEGMYVSGREDSHLDPYYAKHAKETFDEKYIQE